MSRQDYMVERIDRQREHEGSKQARSARSLYLRMSARKTITGMVEGLEPEEQTAILQDALDMIAERLHPLMGRVEAATAFNSRATDICGPLKLPRAVAAARAEQLFAANDREGAE